MIPSAAAGRVTAVAALLVLATLADPGRAEETWRLAGLEGGSLSESDVERGVTIAVVWASWSPRCRKPDIVLRTNRLVERWGERARVALVDFQEEPAEVSAFVAGKSSAAPVFLDADGGFAKRHQVTTLPGLVVYRDGSVAYRGALPDDPDELLGELLR
jgi:hypothetical protein